MPFLPHQRSVLVVPPDLDGLAAHGPFVRHLLVGLGPVLGWSCLHDSPRCRSISRGVFAPLSWCSPMPSSGTWPCRLVASCSRSWGSPCFGLLLAVRLTAHSGSLAIRAGSSPWRTGPSKPALPRLSRSPSRLTPRPLASPQGLLLGSTALGRVALPLGSRASRPPRRWTLDGFPLPAASRRRADPKIGFAPGGFHASLVMTRSRRVGLASQPARQVDCPRPRGSSVEADPVPPDLLAEGVVAGMLPGLVPLRGQDRLRLVRRDDGVVPPFARAVTRSRRPGPGPGREALLQLFQTSSGFTPENHPRLGLVQLPFNRPKTSSGGPSGRLGGGTLDSLVTHGSQAVRRPTGDTCRHSCGTLLSEVADLGSSLAPCWCHGSLHWRMLASSKSRSVCFPDRGQVPASLTSPFRETDSWLRAAAFLVQVQDLSDSLHAPRASRRPAQIGRAHV